MKKFFVNMLRGSVPALAALTVVVAKMFANMPCQGVFYEPDVPQKLKK